MHFFKSLNVNLHYNIYNVHSLFLYVKREKKKGEGERARSIIDVLDRCDEFRTSMLHRSIDILPFFFLKVIVSKLTNI